MSTKAVLLSFFLIYEVKAVITVSKLSDRWGNQIEILLLSGGQKWEGMDVSGVTFFRITRE